MDPPLISKYAEEKAILTCINPIDNGNPNCDVYTWNRVEGDDGIPLTTSKTLEFIMEESRAGNYTCTCGNDFGTSDVSNPAEVIFLTVSAHTEPCRYTKYNFQYIYH